MGYWVTGSLQAAESKSPLEQIQVACVGVGGKGKSDVQNMSRHGKIFALCDVDSQFLKGMAKAYKTEHNFTDYREMLDQMGDRIDAVVISMPDHNHAVIASKAMKMGKHVHCQKPLTHTIWEARRLGEIARETGVATQMGNQFTAFNPMRKAAAQIKAGQLGTVKEVHVWTNRPIWPQGERRPMIKPVPKTLDWERLARPRAVSAVWRRLPSVRLARLVGLRHRRARRHGLPHLQPAVHGAQHARPDRRSRPSAPSTTATATRTARRSSSSSPSWPAAQRSRCTGTTAATCPPRELFAGVTLTTKDDDGKDVPPPYKSGCLIVGDKAKMYAAGDYAELGVQIVGDVEGARRRVPDQPRPREGMVHRHGRSEASPRCRTSPTTPAR